MHEACHVVVEKVCCGTCVHYRQHYVLSEGGQVFAPVVRSLPCAPRKEAHTGGGLPFLRGKGKRGG